MKRIFFFALFILAGTFQLRAGDDPGAPVVSPEKHYKIIQTRQEDGGPGWSWTGKVIFSDSRYPNFTLEPSALCWPALYYISPDEHWILRIQKTGSGDNDVFLYQVSDGGITQATEPSFGEMIWNYYLSISGRKLSEFYHTGFEFVSWNALRGGLTLSLHGTSMDGIPSRHLKGILIRYDLKTQKIHIKQSREL